MVIIVQVEHLSNKLFMTSIVGKYIHRYFLLRHPFFSTSADDYFKWMPYAAVFFLDVFGVRTKSGWKRQLLITGASEAIRYGVADSLKKIIDEQRPAPYTGKNSFPSGHTSSSFAAAEFMHQELKESLPLVSCLGYVAATSTAAIRLMKNKHWLIDVVAGAAVGILATKMAYYVVNRLARRQRKEKDDEINPEYSELVADTFTHSH